MLKSHKNLLEPRPSDRLRIGDRIVDIPLREIAPAAGGDATRVTLKSLGVLLTLVAHANKLVSREALLEWVWPDTLPGDDVVTQAITQLRRALGDVPLTGFFAGGEIARHHVYGYTGVLTVFTGDAHAE